ncbi:MAG: hypothetical protein CMP10_21750 [Zetaproteobacteria bacterium]|nr:hypothetical protein [Pseudobdellovibrionaceae bacterium]
MKKMTKACFKYITLLLILSCSAHSQEIPSILSEGFSPISYSTNQNHLIKPKKLKNNIENYCERLGVHFKKFKWNEDPCGKVKWKAEYSTPSAHPLIYTVFGNGKLTTLLFGGVHPDELTPIPIAFRFARYLAKHPEIYANKKVIVAPLVNPDGFIRNYPSRVNSRGIDLNRNFFTLDWYAKSLAWWRHRKGANSRHFPGYFPNSEIETLFQIQLVDQYRPDKILSIHAPLGFIDYDGPGDRKKRTLSSVERKAKNLAHSISKKSSNYKVVDYSFYPGSLGNFAGNERKIPTITLELRTTNPKKVEEYWNQFLPGMVQAIKYPFSKTFSTRKNQPSEFRPNSPNSRKNM